MQFQLELKPRSKARVLRGHPWVFVSELRSLAPEVFDGRALELLDERGHSLGWGIFNSKSQIVWRRLSRTPVKELDADFFGAAIKASLSRRPPQMRTGRLVWSEADHLPGLVVDRFDDTLVVQTLTLAMDKSLGIICGVLTQLLGELPIVIRNDAPARRHEGLEPFSGTFDGQPIEPHWVQIEGVEYFLDLVGAQKTGFFLDQRQQHLNIARHAKGRRVLDAFCNQGGFALNCAKAGASHVLAIDSSQDCVNAVKRNAEHNALKIETCCANMFDWFTQNRDERFDLIILDPPSFARSKQQLEGALRGYKELNLRALKQLNPGGILATYSCSHGVSADAFFSTLVDAAADSRRNVRLLERTGQPLDHPVLVTMPQSQYLKGLVVSVD